MPLTRPSPLTLRCLSRKNPLETNQSQNNATTGAYRHPTRRYGRRLAFFMKRIPRTVDRPLPMSALITAFTVLTPNSEAIK
ncbi:MAG: hypothetical protein HS127_16785 [Planctomycetia bacterium]|nr:hypothetical protein [Planctomycetia bacterium]